MEKAASAHVYNIPAGVDFLENLASGFKTRFPEPENFSSGLIFLPNRRSCLALRDVFLQGEEKAGDFAMLLPILRPFADISEDDLLLTGDGDLCKKILDLKSAVPPMKRRMLLMQKILERGGLGLAPVPAFKLAGELTRFLDQTLIEGCDFGTLKNMQLTAEYAEHWDKILRFLDILGEEWPEILRKEGLMEEVERRQSLMRLLIEQLKKNPPTYPIVAAGSTGSQPVTAELLSYIAALPQGFVILPGFDTQLEENVRQTLDPSHPQYLLNRLIKKLEVDPHAVIRWHVAPGNEARENFLNEVMRPADVTEGWRQLGPAFAAQKPWAGLSRIDAASEHQEAAVAALLLRQALEEKDKTAALVTPDRSTAARVAAYLRRFDITVDDSAGRPLAETALGSFFLLLLDVARGDAKPSALMALLKHPFTCLGMERITCLEAARALENNFFRAYPCGNGFSTWRRIAGEKNLKEEARFLEKIEKIFLPMWEAKKNLAEWLELHLKWAELCAAGGEALWRGVEGEALAEVAEQIRAQTGAFPYDFGDYAGMVTEILRGIPVRQNYNRHPRLHILGLLEARLLSFDRVILAGLNEGNWPPEALHDPWMSAAMRENFGLPPRDQQVGLTAHDFVQLAAGAKEVFLLRSGRFGETPTIPSRWLLRCAALLKLLDAENALAPKIPWLSYVRRLDQTETLEPCAPPVMKIPAKYLPQRISATGIELLMRDPYAFVADKILRLRPLNPLDGGMKAAQRGTAFHIVLEELIKAFPAAWPFEAAAFFAEELEKAFRASGCDEIELAAMRPRLKILSEAFWEFEKKRRVNFTKALPEIEGSIKLGLKTHDPDIYAKPDRIDIRANGALGILDYKTGKAPTENQMELALRPQLIVAALIVAAGGFQEIKAMAADELAYVKIGEGKKLVKDSCHEIASGELEKLHRPGLSAFISAFTAEGAEFHAAPRPSLLEAVPDYTLLARLAEWSRGVLAEEG